MLLMSKYYDRIPILRLNVKNGNHVVECLDRPKDFWYTVKSFGSTNDDYRKAILYLNNERKLRENMANKITVSNKSTVAEISELYNLNVGDVFKISEGFEGVMEIIEHNIPVGRQFEVYPINPGTQLYTMYGAGHCVVTKNEQL